MEKDQADIAELGVVGGCPGGWGQHRRDAGCWYGESLENSGVNACATCASVHECADLNRIRSGLARSVQGGRPGLTDANQDV